MLPDLPIAEREDRLRAWFTRHCDPIQKVVDGLDIGWGGMQRWATARMPAVEGLHLDLACGYATFLAQLGWRFPAARLVGLNIDLEGSHVLARPLLAQAGVAASLVQADACRLPFAAAVFDSASCFLGLQDIEIGFGAEGVQDTVAEAVRVLRPGGVLTLLDGFPPDRFQTWLARLPVETTDLGTCTPDVHWSREVAERAIALYADGWAIQARPADWLGFEQARDEAHRRMAAEMERQLASQGCYVPFGPVRMIVAKKQPSPEKVLRYAKPPEQIEVDRFAHALEGAKQLLEQHGYACDASVEDLRRYAETDTFYPSTLTWGQILDNPLLVLHEAVEISALKQLGLEITRDVVVRNVPQVYEAHLQAAQVEIEIARIGGNYAHIQDRLKVMEDWTEDPLVPAALLPAYKELCDRARLLLAVRKDANR